MRESVSPLKCQRRACSHKVSFNAHSIPVSQDPTRAKAELSTSHGKEQCDYTNVQTVTMGRARKTSVKGWGHLGTHWVTCPRSLRTPRIETRCIEHLNRMPILYLSFQARSLAHLGIGAHLSLTYWSSSTLNFLEIRNSASFKTPFFLCGSINNFLFEQENKLAVPEETYLYLTVSNPCCLI